MTSRRVRRFWRDLADAACMTGVAALCIYALWWSFVVPGTPPVWDLLWR